MTALSALATAALKKDEAAIAAAGRALNLPVIIVDDAALRGVSEETLSHSDLSQEVAGTPSVSEASALAVAGAGAKLLGHRIMAGVVLNRLGSERHRKLSGDAIEAIGLPVVGAILRDPTLNLPERHLGLVQAGEYDDLMAHLDRLADMPISRRAPCAAIETWSSWLAEVGIESTLAG